MNEENRAVDPCTSRVAAEYLRVSVPRRWGDANVDAPIFSQTVPCTSLPMIVSAWTPPPSLACRSFDPYCVQKAVEDEPQRSSMSSSGIAPTTSAPRQPPSESSPKKSAPRTCRRPGPRVPRRGRRRPSRAACTVSIPYIATNRFATTHVN